MGGGKYLINNILAKHPFAQLKIQAREKNIFLPSFIFFIAHCGMQQRAFDNTSLKI